MLLFFVYLEYTLLFHKIIQILGVAWVVSTSKYFLRSKLVATLAYLHYSLIIFIL